MVMHTLVNDIQLSTSPRAFCRDQAAKSSLKFMNTKAKYFLAPIRSFLQSLAKSVEENSAGKDLCVSLSTVPAQGTS